jgi:hypothetical protein
MLPSARFVAPLIARHEEAAAGGMPAAAGGAASCYRLASSARPCSYAASRDILSAPS